MLRYCLSRRGLALEQANVLSYSNHNKWMEKLLTSRLETAPAGFAKVTFQQLEAADKRLFILLAEKTRAGIKAQPDGRPCDKHFETCMTSTEVVSLLQPKPYAVGSATTTDLRDPKRQKLEHDYMYQRARANQKVENPRSCESQQNYWLLVVWGRLHVEAGYVSPTI